jgi:hypothetical protein
MAKSAQPAPINIRIDLLHPQGEPLQTPQKFLKWALSYGRFIIVVVDIVVIGCFLIRFQLDNELQNTNNQIVAEEASIKSQSAQESLIKQVHQELQTIKQTYETNPEWDNILHVIAQNTPQNTKLSNITFDHTGANKQVGVKITAFTTNNQEVGGFLNNLREASKSADEQNFKNLSVTNLSLDQGAFSFIITGTTNPNKKTGGQ